MRRECSASGGGETVILKTDVLGRAKMPPERREQILDAFERSGMSGLAFAAHIGVKYPTFATWVQKRRRVRGAYPGGKKGAQEFTFLEAVVDAGESAAGSSLKHIGSPGNSSQGALTDGGSLEVRTADGLRLRVRSQGDARLAAALLKALKEGEH